MKRILVEKYRIPCDQTLIPAFLRSIYAVHESGLSLDSVVLVLPCKEEPAEPLPPCSFMQDQDPA